MALSVADANAEANYLTRGVTSPAVVTPIKAALHTGDPGTTGANEATGGTYARQVANYAAPSGGACALAATLSFTGMAAGTYTHYSLLDSAGTPQFRIGVPLATPQTVAGGATINVTAATITVVGA